jgi:hypothetical protein
MAKETYYLIFNNAKKARVVKPRWGEPELKPNETAFRVVVDFNNVIDRSKELLASLPVVPQPTEPMKILRQELCSLAAVARATGLMDAYYAHNTAINVIDRLVGSVQ